MKYVGAYFRAPGRQALVGKKVDVKIDVIHSGDGLRPEGFRVQHTIDGVKKVINFENKAGG